MFASKQNQWWFSAILGIPFVLVVPAMAQVEEEEGAESALALAEPTALVARDGGALQAAEEFQRDPDSPLASHKRCIYEVTKILKKKNCSDCPEIGDRFYIVGKVCYSSSDCKKTIKAWAEWCHTSRKKCKVKMTRIGCWEP